MDLTGRMIPHLGASGGVTGIGVCAREDRYDVAPKADCCGSQPPQAAESCYAGTDTEALPPALHAALICHCAIRQARNGHALYKQDGVMLPHSMRSNDTTSLLLHTSLVSAKISGWQGVAAHQRPHHDTSLHMT